MFLLFETIRISERKALQLSFHQQRMDKSYLNHYHQKNPFDLIAIFSSIYIHYQHDIKCKLSYNDTFFHLDYQIYFPKKINHFIVKELYDVAYSHKYLDRNQIAHDFSDTEFIYTKNALVTDTSFSNIVFLRNKMWFTPKIPLLEGTMRTFLLENKSIHEADISIKNLHEFTHFALINAMLPLEKSNLYPIEMITFE